MVDLEEDDEGEGALLWICRDIPGDHVGGPECFCVPLRLDPNDDAEVARVLGLSRQGALELPS